MAPRRITHDTRLYPGSWKLIMQDSRMVVRVACPGCGVKGTLLDHEIAPDGTVSPSLLCPDACGFHEEVQLEGWNPQE